MNRNSVHRALALSDGDSSARPGTNIAGRRSKSLLHGRHHRIQFSQRLEGTAYYPVEADPKITVNVTYLVGSRHEGYGETGMAHLLEHLDFIETTNGRQIKDEITSHTSTWNGTTSEDRTNYYETFSATDENLKWALGLENRPDGERQIRQVDPR